MLVPAILYKEQIEKEFQKLYYTEDMFYYTFTFHNVSINSRPPTTIISSIGFLLFLSTSFYSPHLISIFLL